MDAKHGISLDNNGSLPFQRCRFPLFQRLGLGKANANIAKYWTRDRIQHATPRHLITFPKESSPQKNEESSNRRLMRLYHPANNATSTLPRRLDQPNQFLLEWGTRFVECRMNYHQTLAQEDPSIDSNIHNDDNQRHLLSIPFDVPLLPPDNAIINSENVDFVMYIQDDDGGDDLRSIILLLDDYESISRFEFAPDLGNGRYSFTIGPFRNGDYRWSVTVKDKSRTSSSKGVRYFTISTPEVPTTPGTTAATTESPVSMPSMYPSSFPSSFPSQSTFPSPSLYPSTFPSSFPSLFPSMFPSTFPSDSTAEPSSTPTKRPTFGPTLHPTPAPTTAKTTSSPSTRARLEPPTPSPILDTNTEISFTYVSPGLGSTKPDPVTFEWEIKPTSGAVKISLVMLYVVYPSGDEGYLTRFPTASGRDSLEIPLEEEGVFEWSLWVQVNGSTFQKGPWSRFTVEVGPTDPSCPENLG